MPKPNYQRDKRQRDLARQRKQEEKRQKKALKDSGAAPDVVEGMELPEEGGTDLEGTELPEGEASPEASLLPA